MALFYASGPRENELGKFHQHRRPGVQRDSHQQCGEFRLELLSMESTTPVRRTRFHLRITTARNVRVAYLRDFSSASAAFEAGRQWVADREQAIHSKHLDGTK